MKTKICISLIILFAAVHSTMSQDDVDAASLYNDAIEAYGGDSIAKAIYNLELAHMLEPYDKDIINNLNVVRAQVKADIIDIDGFFLKEWLDATAGILTPGVWKYLTILLMGGVVWLVYGRLLQKKSSKLFSISTIVSIGVLIGLLFILGSRRESQLHNMKYAIIMDQVTALKLGPDQVSKDVKEVSAGVKLEILDDYDEWYKVSAMDREQGWILKESVKILEFPKG